MVLFLLHLSFYLFVEWESTDLQIPSTPQTKLDLTITYKKRLLIPQQLT